MYRVYLDVETTGFDAIRNDVVSLAAVVTDDDFNIQDKFYDTCKPEFNKYFSEDAIDVHGFTRDDLNTFQDPRDLCIKLLHFLRPFKDSNNVSRLFVSHSLRNFDFSFLEWLFIKQDLQYSLYKVLTPNNQRSTIKAARDAGHKKNKLNEWADRLGIDLTHHHALSDTMACLEVDKYLVKKDGTDLV